MLLLVTLRLCGIWFYMLLVNCAGTVIAAGKSLYLVPDVNAFRARSSSPGGKQGLQVQGPLSGNIGSGAVTLIDASGAMLDTASA